MLRSSIFPALESLKLLANIIHIYIWRPSPSTKPVLNVSLWQITSQSLSIICVYWRKWHYTHSSFSFSNVVSIQSAQSFCPHKHVNATIYNWSRLNLGFCCFFGEYEDGCRKGKSEKLQKFWLYFSWTGCPCKLEKNMLP